MFLSCELIQNAATEVVHNKPVEDVERIEKKIKAESEAEWAELDRIKFYNQSAEKENLVELEKEYLA